MVHNMQEKITIWDDYFLSKLSFVLAGTIFTFYAIDRVINGPKKISDYAFADERVYDDVDKRLEILNST